MHTNQMEIRFKSKLKKSFKYKPSKNKKQTDYRTVN